MLEENLEGSTLPSALADLGAANGGTMCRDDLADQRQAQASTGGHCTLRLRLPETALEDPLTVRSRYSQAAATDL